MIYKKAHCLFEQSGTFKDAFIKLGITAFDYDICNKFKKTDIICDLFLEIRRAFNEESSIFDKMTPDDVIIAFFPCTRFDEQIKLHFRGDAYGCKEWDLQHKLFYDLQLHGQLHENYVCVTKLVYICITKGLKLIIENPFSKTHYLHTYWCIKPSVIHMDRRKYGDYYKKPTQYFFVNITPHDNDVELPKYNGVGGYNPMTNITSDFYKNNSTNKSIARSMIASDYAEFFIKKYII